MNYFDLIMNLIYLFITCGALGFAGNYLNKHHKAKHLASGLEVAQKLANVSVARVATNANLAKGQRKTAVIRELQEVLTKHGYHFDVKRLDGLAEATYQLYKNNGYKVVAPQPTPAPTEDNTTDGPAPKGEIVAKNDGTAEYHPKNELSNDEIKLINDHRAKVAAENK